MAGVNKHWVMLNVVLCKSFQSCVLPWPGLRRVDAVPHSWMKGGGTEVTLKSPAAAVLRCQGELFVAIGLACFLGHFLLF